MQENKFLKFLSFMWNPLSWVMEAAAIMAIVLANGGVSTYEKHITLFAFYWLGQGSLTFIFHAERSIVLHSPYSQSTWLI